ncbi:hypothetical protein Vadar_002049 [Vaccinium darrowii]|uniref:Uncharacterized protein n=1 Tax=Vaccinium darrowii TaxID=229202 RepID=A0ACB7XF45_9ERIC|nr:hypothetical protein Vadar_002049 [Vaccinium darrowii]
MLYKLTKTFPIAENVASGSGSESDSTLSSDSEVAAGGGIKIDSEEISKHSEITKVEMTLLNIYCGGGVMSTGFCLGANMGGVNLVTVIQNSLMSLDPTNVIDEKRVFFSKIKDDNPLNRLIERLRIVRLPSNVCHFGFLKSSFNLFYISANVITIARYILQADL